MGLRAHRLCNEDNKVQVVGRSTRTSSSRPPACQMCHSGFKVHKLSLRQQAAGSRMPQSTLAGNTQAYRVAIDGQHAASVHWNACRGCEVQKQTHDIVFSLPLTTEEGSVVIDCKALHLDGLTCLKDLSARTASCEHITTTMSRDKPQPYTSAHVTGKVRWSSSQPSWSLSTA